MAHLVDIINLDLHNNNLTSLPNYIFKNNQFLTALDLSHNYIGSISLRSFHKLSVLNYLDLRTNILKELSYKCFTFLVSLKFLHLSNMQISKIHDKAFYGLKSLIYLNLKNNLMQGLTVHTFSHLVSLEMINLKNNRLTSVPGMTFAYNGQLKSILSKRKEFCCIYRDYMMANCLNQEVSPCKPILHTKTLTYFSLTATLLFSLILMAPMIRFNELKGKLYILNMFCANLLKLMHILTLVYYSHIQIKKGDPFSNDSWPSSIQCKMLSIMFSAVYLFSNIFFCLYNLWQFETISSMAKKRHFKTKIVSLTMWLFVSAAPSAMLSFQSSKTKLCVLQSINGSENTTLVLMLVCALLPISTQLLSLLFIYKTINYIKGTSIQAGRVNTRWVKTAVTLGMSWITNMVSVVGYIAVLILQYVNTELGIIISIYIIILIGPLNIIYNIQVSSLCKSVNLFSCVIPRLNLLKYVTKL